MKVVVQRVLNSSVVIDDKYEEKINKGLMILLGMTYNDGIEDIDYLVNKILNLQLGGILKIHLSQFLKKIIK